MPLEVLFSDMTFTLGSMGRNEPIKYGVVSEKYTTRIDVVILRNVPTKDVIPIPDSEGGWTEALVLRRKLLILTGNVIPGNNQAVHILENPRIIKEIDSEKIASEVIRVAQRIGSGEIPPTDNTVVIDGVPFKVLRYKPPTSRDDFDNVMTYLYMLVAGRKRTIVSSPAFVEVSMGNDMKWCVTSFPRIIPYLWEIPSDLLVAGLVDPGGFNVPFLVVRNVSWRDVIDVRKQVSAVRWISYLMSQMATSAPSEETTVVEPAEEIKY